MGSPPVIAPAAQPLLARIQVAVAVVLAWRLVPALDWTHISG
jgi:hypothetical protein